jgi:hypothetical protein
MAAKLGSGDVSFRLGSGEVAAVYLGSQEVWSAVQAVTLYFNTAAGTDWATVGNWWLDEGLTEAAGRLPAEIDSAVLTSTVSSNSGGAVVLANLTVEGGSFLDISATVTGVATFNGTGGGPSATVNGNAVFNDSCVNTGTINGNATFNDSSINAGTVTGTATFTGSACNSGGTAGTFVPSPPPAC